MFNFNLTQSYLLPTDSFLKVQINLDKSVHTIHVVHIKTFEEKKKI